MKHSYLQPSDGVAQLAFLSFGVQRDIMIIVTADESFLDPFNK